MVLPDMSQPALTRTTMANEGPATGAANNGSHEVEFKFSDPSNENVEAPRQRAETSSILGNLERMSNSSGLHNSPGQDRAAHPHNMLGNLALGQIHDWQMYSSTPSRQGGRDDVMMSRIMDRLDDLRVLNQQHGVRLDRHATEINQKVGEIQSSVSTLEQKLNKVEDEQKMTGETAKANLEAIRDLQRSTGLTADAVKSNENETKGLQNQVSDLNNRLSKIEAKVLQPESQALDHKGAFKADLLEKIQLWERKLKAHINLPNRLGKAELVSSLHNLGVLRNPKEFPIQGIEYLGKDKAGQDMYTFSVQTKEQALILQRRSWDKKVIQLYPQHPQEYREAASRMGSLARDARAASGNTIATRILYAGTTLRLELKVKGSQTWHGHPTLGSFEPSQPLGWGDTCPREAEAEKTRIAEAIGYEEGQGNNIARPSEAARRTVIFAAQDNSCTLSKIKERFKGLPHLVEIHHHLEQAVTKKTLFRLIFPTRELAIEATSMMNKATIGSPHTCKVGESANLWLSLVIP